MNIFFLSVDPTKAAQAHCDRHVVKMILESTQLLWTAQHLLAATAIADETMPLTKTSGQRGYKPTHAKHPCAIWTRATLGNYRWLCALATALITEYHYRWPHGRTHACEPHVAWLTANPPMTLLRAAQPMTPPALAMPDLYKISPSPTACYKAYYLGQKYERGLLTYTHRDPPHWATHVAIHRRLPSEPKTTTHSKDRSCRRQPTSNSSPVVAKTPT